MYELVKDDSELKWFFDHVIETPKDGESYLFAVACRSKKLTAEDKTELGITGKKDMLRTEVVHPHNDMWNYSIWSKGAYKFNCDERGMSSKTGKAFPAKSLVCYAYVNPSDELDCIDDTIEYASKMKTELLHSYKKESKDGVIDHLGKLGKVLSHLKSCHACHLSRRIWRDFDFDLTDIGKTRREDIEPIICSAMRKYYGLKNFVLVKTSGGYHCLFRVSSIKGNPYDCVNEIKGAFEDSDAFFTEVKMTEAGSQFIPCPGTLQYGNLVTVINKEDFEC